MDYELNQNDDIYTVLEDFDPTHASRYMMVKSSSISACLRVTSCDIMCTSSTFRLYDLPPVKYKAKKAAKLPYRTPDVLPAFSSGSTDLQLLVNAESKQKRSDELKLERANFLSALHDGREMQTQLKNVAAVKIQARFRGYRRRRGTIDLDKLIKDRQSNPKLLSSKIIREELTDWAAAIGLKPVPGLSLESTVKKSLRQRRIEKRAAIKIQYFLRILCAMSEANRRRAKVLKQRQDEAATRIQRFFKYLVFQTKFEGVVALLKRSGAVRIQTYCRGFLARFRCVFMSLHNGFLLCVD